MASTCFYTTCRKALNVNTINSKLSLRSLSSSGKCSTSIQENRDGESPVILPKKITRGPTDILRALNNTLENTTINVPYKYHDDPFLIPSSNVAKRTFALAKESGRKSAQFFVNTYPHQFYHNPAEPNIKVFEPQEKITKDTKVTEKLLRKLVINRQVEDGIQAYRNLLAEGEEIKNGNLYHDFFELLCFYACKDPLAETELEALWYQQPGSENKKSWPTECLADEMFQANTRKSARLYNAYASGLLKHLDIKKGLAIYQTMLQDNIPVSRELYNLLIKTIPYQTDNLETRWSMAQSYMRAMADNKLGPDQNTFNGVLETLSKSHEWPGSKPAALSVMAEMRTLAIAPSLASYYFLLTIFSKKRGDRNVSPILSEIMDLIRNQKMEIQHPNDVNFLVTAMETAAMVYKSKTLSHDLHSFYLSNPHFIGGGYNESQYYYYFFRLLLATETMDGFFDYYNFYVPYRYTPEPNLMLAILNKIDFYYAYHHLNQLWKDIALFNQYKNTRIIDKLLEMMAREEQDQAISHSFMLVATDLKEKIDIELERGLLHTFPWTGRALGHLLTIFIRAGNMAKAEEVMTDLLKSKERLVDLPSEDTLRLACHAFFFHNMPDHSLKCLEYALSTCNYLKLGKEISEKADQYNLSDRSRSKLEAILGANPIKSLPEHEQ